MIHPHTTIQHVSDTVGYGVFATQDIPEGTIVYVKDSMELEISPMEFLTHQKEIQEVIEKYSYMDQRGYRIVSWDFAKYVNHCCNYNTISTGYGFEIAIRDIKAGEQITDEYGIFNLEYEIDLTCAYDNCRQVLKPKDFDSYYQKWDEVIKKSLTKMNDVTQPLLVFVDENSKIELNSFLSDPNQYQSVYRLKYQKDTASLGEK
jgi:hypothetical protein